MMLADMGAEVMKVEIPKVGDHSRSFALYAESLLSPYFLQFNRNKKSMTLNLKAEEGKRIFLKLAERADVIVENYRPGVMKNLGLEYDAVSKVNPQIVYCSISGFGQYGPYRRRAAFDTIAQGMAGLLTPYSPDPPFETLRPFKPHVSPADIGTGMYAAFAIVCALYARRKMGKGQYIDVAMYDSMITWREDMALYSVGAVDFMRGSGPDRPFKTKDIYVVISAALDEHFFALCDILGLGELKKDPRFSVMSERAKSKNQAELVWILEKVTSAMPGMELVEKLAAEGIPCGPVNDLEKIFADPHVKAREMVYEFDHPVDGRKVKVPGIPTKMSSTPPRIRSIAPRLGQHTEEILVSLGYTKDETAKLREISVV